MKNLLTINENSTEAIALLSDRLDKLGLKMERSFDLRIQQNENVECSCPHHGTIQCDCQIVVLLIYGKADGPDTIVAHSRDGRTVFSLEARPERIQTLDLVNIFHNLKIAEELTR
jgi:hypothetical protein